MSTHNIRISFKTHYIIFNIIILLLLINQNLVNAQPDCSPLLISELMANDGGGPGEQFGCSVAIGGDDTAIVGVRYDDYELRTGSAYIYNYDPNISEQWKLQQILMASDGARYDSFGVSVAIDGDVAVVGADSDDDNGEQSGSVYVFRYDRGGSNIWIEEQKLLAADGKSLDYFGHSVAIDNDIIVVGAYKSELDYADQGAAYIFRYNSDGSQTWEEEQKLSTSDNNKLFGNSVSVSGKTVAIGAPGVLYNRCSVHLYRYDKTGSWVHKYTIADKGTENKFGNSVCIRNDVLIVGAYMSGDSYLKHYYGAAYIYRYHANQHERWLEEDYLSASDRKRGCSFGFSVALNESGTIAVIGDNSQNVNGTDSGAAYIFVYDENAQDKWTEHSILKAPEPVAYDEYGFAVAISDNKAIIGSHYDDSQGSDSGSAYIYEVYTDMCPQLTVTPKPLYSGETASFSLAKAYPDTETYLVYSIDGAGSTNIPHLNITLDINNPKRIYGMRITDATGYAECQLKIPYKAARRKIWFQACQFELKSNLVITRIL